MSTNISKAEARRIATVLRRQKKILNEKGWTKNRFENFKGEVCELGALRIAIFKTTKPAILLREPLTLEEQKKYNLYHRSEDALGNCLSVKFGYRNIAYFNDHVAKSIVDITENIDCAIDEMKKIYTT